MTLNCQQCIRIEYLNFFNYYICIFYGENKKILIFFKKALDKLNFMLYTNIIDSKGAEEEMVAFLFQHLFYFPEKAVNNNFGG